tara:strand:- start:676 stop:1407 length:732 start_codon:yes stop_codon:yes gene_type:complete
MRVKLKQLKGSAASKFVTTDTNKDVQSTHDFNASALPFSFDDSNVTIDNVADAINLIWSTLKSASPTADEVITQDMEANESGVITTSLELSPDDLSDVILVVNGVSYDSFGADPAFTISGTTVIWNASSVETQFALDTTDSIVAQYTVKGDALVVTPFIEAQYIQDNYFTRGDTSMKYTEIAELTANVAEEILHNLNSDDIVVSVWDNATNTQISATVVIVNANRIDVTTTQNYASVKVVVIK